MITFEIPGDPRGKGRPKFARRGAFTTTYTDDKTAAYENLVALAARDVMQRQGQALMEGPVSVLVYCGFRVPASTAKSRVGQMLQHLILPLKKPDADNVAKAVLDGLNGVAYLDDTQVTDLTVIRRFDERPRVVVRLSETKTPAAGVTL
jgi:Holliday junction resolvase RusA-like endonuclease